MNSITNPIHENLNPPFTSLIIKPISHASHIPSPSLLRYRQHLGTLLLRQLLVANALDVVSVDDQPSEVNFSWVVCRLTVEYRFFFVECSILQAKVHSWISFIVESYFLVLINVNFYLYFSWKRLPCSLQRIWQSIENLRICTQLK